MRGIAKLFGRIGKRSFFGLTALSLVISQVALVAPVFALDSTLSGQVTGGNNSQAIESAVVDVLDQSTSAVVGTDDTDAGGNYAITVAAGTYNVRVTPPAASGYQVANLSDINLSANQNLNVVLVLQPELPPPPPTYIYSVVVNAADPNETFGCGFNCNIYLKAADGTQYTSSVVLDFNTLTATHNVAAPAGQYKIGVDGSGLNMESNNPVVDLTGNMTQDFVVNREAVNIQVIDENNNPVPNARVQFHMSGGTGDQLIPDNEVTYGNLYTAVYTSGTGDPAAAQILTGANITSIIVDSTGGLFEAVTVNNPVFVNGTMTVQVQTLPPPPVNYTWTGNMKDTNGNLLGCGSIFTSGCVVFEAGDGTDYTSSMNISVFAQQITAPSGQYKVSLNANSNTSYKMTGLSAGFDLSGNVTQDLIINQEVINVEVIDQYGNPVAHASATIHTSGGTGTQLLPGYQVSYGDNSSSAGTDASGNPAAVKTLPGSPVTSVVVGDGNSEFDFDSVTVNNPTIVNGTIQVQVLTDAAPPPPVFHTLTTQLRDQAGNLGGCGTLANGCLYLESTDGTKYDGVPNIQLLAYQVTAPAGQYKVGTASSPIFGLNMSGINPVINLDSDMTQDMVVNHVTLNITVIDQFGNPVTGLGAYATVDTEGGTGTQLLPDYEVSYGLNQWNGGASTVDGVIRARILPGSPIKSIYIRSLDGAAVFDPVTLTDLPALTQDGNIVVQLQLPYAPDVPQNLSAASPTKEFPLLSWDAVAEASSYKVFRGGDEIGTATAANFTDETLTADGTYEYTVKACNQFECSEASDVITVVYDTTAPVVTGVPDRQPNANGWYDADVTIDWQVVDPSPGSGTPTDPPDTIVSQEGIEPYTSAQSCDPAGNCATGSLELSIDKTAPVVGGVDWSTNPQTEGNDVTMVVSGTDALSDMPVGEYFIGTDPGVGNGAPMSYPDSTLTATFGSDLEPGTYQVGVRIQDRAGNWSDVFTSELVINPIDSTPPLLMFSVDPPANAAGWHNGPVSLWWDAEDAESEITSEVGCWSGQVTAEGENAFSCSVTSTGGTTTETAVVKIDTTVPTLGEGSWSANPVAVGTATTLSVPVADNLSGATNGEYFIGTDPGIGGGTAMTLTGNVLESTFDLPIGTHTINVRVKDAADNWSEPVVLTLTVEDPTAPVITYQLSQMPGLGGWHNAPIVLTWNLIDPESTITGQTGCDSVNVNTETTGTTVTCSATSAGGTASESVTVMLDMTGPLLGTPVWTNNPMTVGGTTSFTVPATDTLSGVVSGEYFIGTDPGVGSATALAWDGTNLVSDTFGSTLAAGVHAIGVRAKDTAGNWSTTDTVYLVVSNPTTFTQVLGEDYLKPDTNDVLPGFLGNPDQKDRADFGFDIRLLANGQIDPASEFSLNYETGKKCNSPNPENCHMTIFTASTFSWLILDGTNNSRVTFQGVGALQVDGGAQTTNPFKVVATDSALSGDPDDTVTIHIYAEGVDPNSPGAQPLYSVDGIPQGGNSGVEIN